MCFDWFSIDILDDSERKNDKTDPRLSSPVGNFLAQNKLLWNVGPCFQVLLLLREPLPPSWILNSFPDWLNFVAAILDLENNRVYCSRNNSLLYFSAPNWLRLIWERYSSFSEIKNLIYRSWTILSLACRRGGIINFLQNFCKHPKSMSDKSFKDCKIKVAWFENLIDLKDRPLHYFTAQQVIECPEFKTEISMYKHFE